MGSIFGGLGAIAGSVFGPLGASAGGAIGNAIDSNIERNDVANANSDTWKMMQYQNWWNSPVQIRKRYEDAGFNPNFIAGGSPIAAANTQPPRTASPGDGKGSEAAMNSMLAAQDLKLKDAQMDNLATARKEMEANVMKTWADADVSTATAAEIRARTPRHAKDILKVDSDMQSNEQDRAYKDWLMYKESKMLPYDQSASAAATNRNNQEARRVYLQNLHLPLQQQIEADKALQDFQEQKQRMTDREFDIYLKKREAELARKGLRGHDNMFFRFFFDKALQSNGKP